MARELWDTSISYVKYKNYNVFTYNKLCIWIRKWFNFFYLTTVEPPLYSLLAQTTQHYPNEPQPLL